MEPMDCFQIGSSNIMKTMIQSLKIFQLTIIIQCGNRYLMIISQNFMTNEGDFAEGSIIFKYFNINDQFRTLRIFCIYVSEY